MRDTLRLERLERTVERVRKPDLPGLRLSYAQRILNPITLAASPAVAGDFPQTGTIVMLAFRASVFVQTTNNGSNYWTIDLINTAGATLATFDTSALSTGTWTRLAAVSLTQPSSSNVDLAVRATATGSPGNLFLVPELVVVPG